MIVYCVNPCAGAGGGGGGRLNSAVPGAKIGPGAGVGAGAGAGTGAGNGVLLNEGKTEPL